MSGYSSLTMRPMEDPGALEPPPLEVPFPLSIEPVVARGEGTTLALCNWRVHSTGFLMTLVVWEDDRFPEFPGQDLMSLVKGNRDGTFDGLHLSGRYELDPDGAAASGGLAAGPFLGTLGFQAHDGPRRAALEYWVFPLPELGATRLTLEWKSRGIGPVSATLRGSVLRAASGRVRVVSVGSAGGAK